MGVPKTRQFNPHESIRLMMDKESLVSRAPLPSLSATHSLLFVSFASALTTILLLDSICAHHLIGRTALI